MNRIGFHYFPDSHHYCRADLEQWLPRLKSLGAAWVTLVAHPSRAIPEFFLKSLLSADITPVLQIPCKVDFAPKIDELETLFSCYARWGIRYISFFDRPNCRQAWSSSSWPQTQLVERFLDSFLPICEAILAKGLTPVFPPLEPGGDYWDTAFLDKAIRGAVRRGYLKILDRIVLGAEAWSSVESDKWEIEPSNPWKPNQLEVTSARGQDEYHLANITSAQIRIEKILGHKLPVIVLRAGCRLTDSPEGMDEPTAQTWHAFHNQRIYQWISGKSEESLKPGFNPPPPEVLAYNFWLLCAGKNHPDYKNAWYPLQKRPLPVVEALYRLSLSSHSAWIPTITPPPGPGPEISIASHYVLMPASTDSDPNKLLEIALPFAQRKHAKMGSSLETALNAKRVTILGSSKWLPEAYFEHLHSKGCMIEEVYGDGILLATKLATL